MTLDPEKRTIIAHINSYPRSSLLSNTPISSPQSDAIRIGTRGSRLALWQAHYIQSRLEALHMTSEITIIKTQGDRIDNVPFSKLEGKGFFTVELEDAQLDERVDLAVHSLKDLSTDMPTGLTLVAMVGREDPREILLAKPDAVDPAKQAAGDTLPLVDGAVVGTSAARRQAQLKHLRPDLKIKDLRGNVPTRVNRLREGNYDAILLAHAGVLRLELDVSDLFTKPLPVDEFIPAPAQGMLGIQCRDQKPWTDILADLDNPDAGRAVAAERDILKRLEGGCQLPFGINIVPRSDGWRLGVFLADGDDAARTPLVFHLEHECLESLTAQAWDRICDYRKAAK